MSTLLIVLFSAAISVVFTQGEIFKFLRRGPWLWRELASCALCSGVWIGAAMWCLFSGFPHVGDDLLISARAVAYVLGVGSLSGCVALLFVMVWEKLDEKAAAHVRIETAQLVVQNPEITAQKIRFTKRSVFPDEAPTDPTTSDSRLTKKVSTERLPIAQSRRSNPDEEKR
jgi:hypothetical protein